MPGSCVVAQGEMVGRPSFLHVEVRDVDGELVVRVGGGVRVVGEGAFRALSGDARRVRFSFDGSQTGRSAA